jgi:hypothetical protein
VQENLPTMHVNDCIFCWNELAITAATAVLLYWVSVVPLLPTRVLTSTSLFNNAEL